jgi:hypothetical protein
MMKTAEPDGTTEPACAEAAGRLVQDDPGGCG